MPFFFIVVLGTVNGSNFTDGLDGLESSVTVLIATFFTVVAIAIKSDLSPITGAVAGSLMAFLLYNVYPAKVFMGDTGSLALGGFVAATAFMLKMPLFILLVAIVYFVEILSVMLQVGYYKITGGKRIFKMAPIHHHFELMGWSETRVVAVFSIVTAMLCLISIYGYGLTCGCPAGLRKTPPKRQNGAVMQIKDKKVLVFGAGKSGVAAARLLQRQGAKVLLYDSNTELRDKDFSDKLDIRKHFRLLTGVLDMEVTEDLALLVISPGIAVDHPDVQKIAGRGVPVWGEIELAYCFSRGKIIGLPEPMGRQRHVLWLEKL